MENEKRWKRDCKSFPGIYACDIMTAERYKDCNGCPYYEPYTKKILIIKLGALGDVLRTTPLLHAIKKRYGNPLIYWLVKEESKPFLENNIYIDKILIYNLDMILRLMNEKFDILYSLEIDYPAIGLANLIKAEEKFGFFANEDGHPAIFNKEAKHYLEMVFSNHLKKENRKSYQEIIFEICKMKYNKEEIILELTNKDKSYGTLFMKKHHIKKSDKIIGVNIGAGPRWIAKSWNIGLIIELIKKLYKNYKVLLLAGPEEVRIQKDILLKLKKEKIIVIPNNPQNNLKEFASVMNICSLIITGDTMALHLAVGLKKEVVALFFCTPPWEIESYGKIKKIVSPLLDNNLFSEEYNEELSNSISVKEVFKTIEQIR